MMTAQFQALVESIRNSPFTREQLGKLLQEVVGRICRLQDVPELEETQHDLSESCENYSKALDEINDREGLDEPPDEMDLARERRAVEEPV